MRRRLRLLPLLVAAVLTVVGTGRAAAACSPTGDSGVVDASNTSTRSEGEESVSLDPINPQWAIEGANEGSQGGGANGLNETPAWWSHDGGCTWHPVFPDLGGLSLGSTLPLGPQAPEFREVGNVLTADQDSAWDTHGNAYFSDIQVSGLQGGDTQIRVAHSVDGGITWSPPVVAFSSQHSPTPVGTEYALGQIPLDRPWLAVDRSGGPRDGTVYVTWETSPFTPGLPPEVFAASSTDHGQTWSRAVRVDDGTYTTQFNPRQFPAVGPDGTLYVVYDLAGPMTTVVPGVQGGTIKLGIGVSTDGGQTFSHYIVDPNVHRVDDPDEATPEYSETISSLAADPRRAGTVAVAWPEALSSSNSRIELRVSVNGGRTWSARVDVADDPASRNDEHDHAAVSFGPDGKLYVEWRDRRFGGGTWDGPYDVWVRQVTVTPSGATQLGPAVRMTSSSQPATTVSTSTRSGTLSEFYGLATAPGQLAAAWDQVVGSLTDAVFHRVALSAFQTPAALPTALACSGPVRITLRPPADHARISRVTVSVNGHRVAARLIRHRRSVLVVLRRLPSNRPVTIKIVVETSSHRRYEDSRTYAHCALTRSARRRARRKPGPKFTG